jgi:signal transduction histidine kinase
MTQVDEKRTGDTAVILRDILHIIATAPSPMQCVEPVLESGRTLASAQGAALILFNDPQLIQTAGIVPEDIPTLEALKLYAQELPYGIHLNPSIPGHDSSAFPSWLLAHIRVQRQTVGVLWMVFNTSETQPASGLDIFIDGLTIVATHLRSQARHEKITRNQNEFIRIVSHDLRSPLTSMQGFASMLESGMVGELNEKQQHFVERILSGIAQMTAQVENIQDAGRYDPENGFYEIERSHCDVVGIVHKIMGNQLIPADKQELSVTTDIADDIPIINADIHMLERAITNLVDNAIKYTPDKGKIVVGVKRKDDHIVIYVQDNGLGITPENQKLLFERHRRIPREEHKRIKGTGLGLFIVRSVAQRHGGDAWVESTAGKGSTFYIRIPISGPNALIAEPS